MKKIYIWGFIALLASYIALAYTVPADPKILEKYALSEDRAKLLSLSTILPLIAIYITALYGFLRFDEYANRIRNTKEGPYYKKISRGLMVLAFSLPFTSAANSLFSHIKYNNPDFLPTSIILRNYLALAFTFVSLLLIAKGAEELYKSIKHKSIATHAWYVFAVPIALASLFTWLIVSQDYRSGDIHGYYLPEWLVITTLAIPFVYIWCIGMRSVFHLHKYKIGVKGKIYKQAFDYFSKGMAVIVGMSILLRLLTTLAGPLNRLDLTPLLLIVYLIVLLYAVGYGMVALGAKKLNKLEDV